MEEPNVDQREKDIAALRTALDKLYGKGPEAELPHDDPVAFFRQLRRSVRAWLQGLSDEDVATLEAVGRQHQTAASAWRRIRKLVAWLGATILATLAFGDQ